MKLKRLITFPQNRSSLSGFVAVMAVLPISGQCFWSEPGSRAPTSVGEESPDSVWQQAPVPVHAGVGGGATRRKVPQKIYRPSRFAGRVRVKWRGKSPPFPVATPGCMVNPLRSKTK